MAINSILGLFAQSPFKPLQEHSFKVTECCDMLVPFFETTFAENWDKAEKIRVKIVEAEREADMLKREIRLKLPRGLFMPIARTDLLELVTQQDKIANMAKDISGRIAGRHLFFPKILHTDFLTFLNRNLEATRHAHLVVDEMDQLLETGFRGRELSFVNNMINELDIIEDDSDNLQIILRRSLLQLEPELNPIDVTIMYKIIESVGALADQAERVGSRIELMLARS